MIKGQTKSGIEFTLNEEIKNDVRFVRYYRKIKDENVNKEEKADYVFLFLEVIFGSERGVNNFMNTVASVHDGVCTPEALWDELNEMLEVLDVKNSSSSQAS